MPLPEGEQGASNNKSLLQEILVGLPSMSAHISIHMLIALQTVVSSNGVFCAISYQTRLTHVSL